MNSRGSEASVSLGQFSAAALNSGVSSDWAERLPSSNMPVMQYREVKPKPPLSEFVECFWTLEGDGRAETAGDLILPDGCVEMVLNFGDPFCEHKQHKGSRQWAVGSGQ